MGLRGMVNELRCCFEEAYLKPPTCEGEGQLACTLGLMEKMQKLGKHYKKTCSMDAFKHNVEYFYKVKGKEWKGSKEEKRKRAIAASYSSLRRACGIPSDAPRMTPKQMIAGE